MRRLFAAGLLLASCAPEALVMDGGGSLDGSSLSDGAAPDASLRFDASAGADAAEDAASGDADAIVDARGDADTRSDLDSSRPDGAVDGGQREEAQWQTIVAMPNTWIYRARDAFRDAAQTMRVGNNDEIASFRAVGTGIPAVNGVAGVANLQWLGRADYQSPLNPVWYASFGRKPTFVDRGGGDEYVRLINGLPTNYETEPGSLSAPVARGEAFHAVHLFRAMPGASYEGLLAGIAAYKDRAGDGQQVQVSLGSTTLVGRSGAVARWGEDNIVEIVYRANGDVELSLNGAVVLSGNLPSLPMSGFTEFVLGTNSHVSANHFRAIIMRRGGTFSPSELATIRAVSDGLWPRGRMPRFPYLDGQYRNDWRDFDAATKTWRPGVGAFSGGSGSPGTHAFQWYYWSVPSPSAVWPRTDKLDYHVAVPGPRGQLATLTRSDYEAGNRFGNPVIFTAPGTRQVFVMRVVTPVDSAGVRGEPLAGFWAPDETP